MFRNPRENAMLEYGQHMTPSVGRPPSPRSTSHQTARPHPASMSKMATRAAAAPTPARKPSTPSAKPKNGNIMSFFTKKSDQSPQQSADPLFVDGANYGDLGDDTGSLHDSGYEGLYEEPATNLDGDEPRFNEHPGSNKRRRLSTSPTEESADQKDAGAQHRPDAAGAGTRACSPPPSDFNDQLKHEKQSQSKVGPFLEDSESEDEEVKAPSMHQDMQGKVFDKPQEPTTTMVPIKDEPQDDQPHTSHTAIPALSRQSTSYPDPDAFADFEGMGDFEDEYEEGDENAERRWQMEQQRLEEAEREGAAYEGDGEYELESGNPTREDSRDGLAQAAATCPICSASFEGVSDQEASVHVNHCLDGKPTPLPTKKVEIKTEPVATANGQESSTPKFRRPVRPAKPGQENPFTLGEANGTSSAFGKLMSGHTEDTAWAAAAAAEQASRGKPAYTRTCPFYKILPGFNICVDAFRYGAVQGCKAYFLSHFHSDHYIGLTSTWCHGPIYCSRATANLVRQQLRVDPKWVVDLEFEKKVEVPGSNGVEVTMIPANHCPGSSLYLFEKVLGTGPTAKTQRVLHCGDFRACPAHVEHPLLKPEVIDSISGKTAHQKLDVCYLDTTYLNPKYAFPSQEDVIQACADMCVSLNKTKVDKDDSFEKMKSERAGGSMAKFVRQDSKDDTSSVNEIATSADADGVKVLEPKTRGKLLVVVGTYSIGKERICLGIARALGSLIYAPAGKQRICAALEDPELLSRLTSDPREAQVHMTPLFEIRAESLGDYLAEYSDRFSRAVGFRPSGWNYRPPGSRFTESPAVGTVLYSENWKSGYSMKDLVPQRGSNARSATYGVPYSEHSSFRELTMFCCALRIDKIIPTVNIGSAKSREKMKMWVDRWNTHKKKEGLFRPAGPRAGMGEVKVKDEEDDEKKQDGFSEWYPARGTWELRTTL